MTDDMAYAEWFYLQEEEYLLEKSFNELTK